MRLNIVADEHIPFLKGVFEPFGDVVYLPGERITRQSLEKASVLIVRSVTRCDQNLLADTPVEFIATATIGDDHIDAEYCRRNAIQWANAKGCNADAVTQYVTASLLELAHLNRMKLAGKVLGILGAGNIGSRVERVARKLDMQPLLYDPPRARKEGKGPFVTVDDIREKSDFLTLHVPLTKEGQDKTEGLLDEDFFDGLGKTPFLINTARGAVVKSGAVTNALKQGRLGGIVFDVWENEPNIDPALLEKALLATPHIAGYSREGKFNATALVVEAVANFTGIEPIPPMPYALPRPDKVSVPDGKKEMQDLLESVFRTICPLLKETGTLKKYPWKFMEHRKNYTLRRDNNGIQLELEDCSPNCKARLRDLEFNIIEI